MSSVGRYEILKEIGRGAMGVVYLGRDPNIGRLVALKCLSSNLDEEARRRFHQEALALGRLIHPNIVSIFDVGEDLTTGSDYIVMEYIEGVSLAEMLKKNETLALDDIRSIGLQVCTALHFAHSKKVIHRDIKPGNILLSQDSTTVKVADFGIARLDLGARTQTHCFIGTPNYMSPEQCKGEAIDGRSDIFSVGAMLYELLTRQKAFPGENITAIIYAVLNHVPVEPTVLFPNIPKSLSGVVMKAIEKDPNRRFSTGEAFADALRAGFSEKNGQTNDATLVFAGQDRTQVLRLERTKPSILFSNRGRWVVLIFVIGTSGLLGWWVFQSNNVSEERVSLPPATEPNGVKVPINGGEKEPPSNVNQGTMVLSTEPDGAEIWINGEQKGLSPFTVDLPQGSYELTVKKNKHHPIEATIEVLAGVTTPIRLTLLEEEDKR